MANLIALPLVRLVQRLSMLVAVACFAYVIFFLVSNPHDKSAPNTTAPVNAVALEPPPVLDLKPYDLSVSSRDIFSASSAENGAAGSLENTPKGQLPDHLKIVGIVVGHPSQIIIEDSGANKTYFIDEGHSEAGIRILQVHPDQMIINYQGQNISVPISKT